MKHWIVCILILANTCSYARSLRIGVEPYNPPYCIQIDKNHYTGFDIMIISEICRRIHANCSYIPIRFNNIFSSLDQNKIDLAIATITITPEREHNYLFSIPYLPSDVKLLTNRSSPINSIKDIRNKKIGTHTGVLTTEYVTRKYQQPVKVTQYPTSEELLLALNDKLMDAILLEVGTAQYWFANNSGQYKLIPPVISAGDGYGVVAKKDQHALISEINSALKSMESDGTYVKIYKQYLML